MASIWDKYDTGTAPAAPAAPAIPPAGKSATGGFDDLISATAKKYGVDPEYIRASMKVESGGNPNAFNAESGAVGLAQAIPDTAKRYGIDPKDPGQSIDLIGKMTRESLDRHKAKGRTDDPYVYASNEYHGGTDEKNWGPKTADRTQKVMDGMGKKPAAGASIWDKYDVGGGDAKSAIWSSPKAPAQPEDNSYGYADAGKKGLAGLKVTWSFLAKELAGALGADQTETEKILQQDVAEYAKLRTDPKMEAINNQVREASKTSSLGPVVGAIVALPKAVMDAGDPLSTVGHFMAEQIIPSMPGFILGAGAGAAFSRATMAKLVTSELAKKGLTTAAAGAAGNAMAVVTSALGSNYVEGLKKNGGDPVAAREYAITKTMAEIPANAAAGALMGVKLGPNELVNILSQSVVQGAGGAAGAAMASNAVGEKADPAELAMEYWGEFASAPVEGVQAALGHMTSRDNQDPATNQDPAAEPIVTKTINATGRTPEVPTVDQSRPGVGPFTDPATGQPMGDGTGGIVAQPQPSVTLPPAKAAPPLPTFETYTGKEVQVSTPTGETVGAQFAIADADSLTTSFTESGAPNQGYFLPPGANRVDQINLDPERVAESLTSADGAPIVGNDGQVESGNNRINGIRRAYRGPSGTDYKQWLLNNLNRFGIPESSRAAIEQMDRPALVRLRTTPVDRNAFVIDSNAPAGNDIRRGPPPPPGGAVVPDPEKAQTRIRIQALGSLLPGFSGASISAAEITPFVAGTVEGITRAAPALKDASLAPNSGTAIADLAQALADIAMIRSQGLDVAEVLAQIEVLGEEFKPEVIAMIAALDEAAGNPERVQSLVEGYAKEVTQNPNQSVADTVRAEAAKLREKYGRLYQPTAASPAAPVEPASAGEGKAPVAGKEELPRTDKAGGQAAEEVAPAKEKRAEKAAPKKTGTQFSRAPSSRAAVKVRDVEAAIAPFTSRAKGLPKIHVLQSDSDKSIPKSLRDEIAKEPEGSIEGAYHDGEVYLFADNLRDTDHAAFTFLHEAGHHGLAMLLGTELDAVLLRIWQDNPAVQLAASKMVAKHGVSRVQAVNEVLADWSAEGKHPTILQKLVASIRDIARRLGWNLKMNDADVLAIVAQSRRRWQKGDTKFSHTYSAFSSRAPIFYSQMAQVVAQKGSTGNATDWKARLSSWAKSGAYKPDELQWSGVMEWLDLQQGKVTTEQVVTFLRENGVKVEETVLDGDSVHDAEERLYRMAQEREAQGDYHPFLGAILSYEPSDVIVAMSQGYDGPREIVDLAIRFNEMKAGEGAQYASYQLPGGKNYREVLLTLPEGASTDPKTREWYRMLRKLNVEGLTGDGEYARFEALGKELGMSGRGTEFRSGHWDEPNVLAHIRVNERTDSEGRRVLFVEEIQSDWAQNGRKHGFGQKTPTLTVRPGEREELIARTHQILRDRLIAAGFDLETANATITGSGQRYNAIAAGMTAEWADLTSRELQDRDAIAAAKKVVPSAPFVGKTDAWVSLALKRVIRMASEGGFDAVAFVTGEQSADRYDLSRQVDQLVVYDDNVLVARKSGLNILERSFKDEADLAEIIGKDAAKKLLEARPDMNNQRVLSGQDLSVGGEGMKAFYDKIVPNVAKDVLKKVGGGQMTALNILDETKRDTAQIGLDELPDATPEQIEWQRRYDEAFERGDYDAVAQLEIEGRPDPTADQAEKLASSRTLSQPGFLITDEIREKAMGGMPLFSRGGAGKPLEKGKAIPESVERAAHIESAIADAKGKKFKTNRDFKAHLQARFLAAARAARVTFDNYTQAVEDYLVRMVESEGRRALEKNANAVGWYDEKVTKALRIVALIHPEVLTDRQAKFAFVWALAVTSNGMEVDRNFQLAEKAYRHYKATGKMPTDIGEGTAKSDINDGLGLFNSLMEKHGFDALESFMTTMTTAKQAAAFSGKKVSGENLTTMVYGAAILGPKIGNGFFMNLYGRFEQLTMDRWNIRTWGRWTGTLIEENPEQVKLKRDQIKSLVRAMTPEQRAEFERIIKKKLRLSDPDGMAQAILRASTKKSVRDEMFKVGLGEANQDQFTEILGKASSNITRHSIGDELRKTGNALAKYLDGQKEDPSGPPERGRIRKVYNRALEALREGRPKLTMADLQAVLWYPEKLLYESAASADNEKEGYGDGEAPDYANAAAKLARENGISQGEIDRVIKEVDDELQADGRAADARPGERGSGAGQERGQAPGGEERVLEDINPRRAGDRGGRDAGRGLAPLEGAPTVSGATGPDPALVAVAEGYARDLGITLRRQAAYVEVDEARAARIAAAYEAMPHAPQDAAVKEAYENLIQQTRAQYDALVKAGYEFTFFDGNTDPYGGTPWNAMRHLRANKRMAVYGTYDGYGTEGVTGAAIENNPMLADTGLRWKDQSGVEHPVLANDLFRAVHDAFGHGLEGAGFRARGEENAWQAHVRLFTGSAIGAITSETRGQNSWLNYGPHGETNRTAQLEDTVFAEQKTGLMPAWTWEDGIVGDAQGDGNAEGQGDGAVLEDLGRPDASGGGRDRGLAGGDLPSHGTPREGASEFVGVHFSTGQRQELDSLYYGRGMKGAEAVRLKNSTDQRIKRRVYFYADAGGGIRPESGVGHYGHGVRLSNIYDATRDPLGLKKSADANAFESAVLDAGFDGYAAPFGNQTGIVLLGDQRVPVRYLGMGSGAVSSALNGLDNIDRISDGQSRPGMDRRIDTPRVSAIQRLRKIVRLSENGPDAQSWREIARLIEDLEQKIQIQEDKYVRSERARGADWVRERLMRGRRQGELDATMVDMALWMIDQNPEIANDLGISVSGADTYAAGNYNPVSRIMRLFSQSAKVDTGVHEILHHTEKMMPAASQEGIAQAWSKALWKEINAAIKSKNTELEAALRNMMLAMAGDRTAHRAMIQHFDDGVLDYVRHYQLANPSEFWAVNATRIMAKRYEAQGQWVAQAKRWLGEFTEKAKGLLGLPSDAAVLRGLRDVMNGQGAQLSPTMIMERVTGRSGGEYNALSIAGIAKALKPGPIKGMSTRVIDRIDRALTPLGSLPAVDAYLAERGIALGKVASADKIGHKLYKAFAKQKAQVQKEVYDYLTTQGASPATISDPKVRQDAVDAKLMIEHVGDELEAHGLLDATTNAANRGGYLPRVYLKYLLSDDGWKAVGTGRKPSTLGYLIKRENIPQAVRDVILGEIKDPGYLANLAFTRSMRDMALLDWLEGISQKNEWVYRKDIVQWQGQRVTAFWLKNEADRIRKQIPYYTGTIARQATTTVAQMDAIVDPVLAALQKVPEDFRQMPNSPRYGRLRGMYVRKEIYDDIIGVGARVGEDAGFAEKLLGYGGIATKATQMWKTAKVALNPPAQIRNFLSNGILLQLSGVSLPMVPIRMAQAISEIRLGKKIEEAKRQPTAAERQKMKHWLVAQKYGITVSTFSSQELFRAERELVDLKARMRGAGSFAHLLNIGAKIAETAGDIYQFSEALYKTAKIIDEIEKGATEEEAAAEAQKWLFDYSLVNPSIRYLRNAPVGAPFLTFSAKVAPRLLEVAMHKPWRFAPWVALAYGLPMIIASMGGPDEEDQEKIKKLLPESWRDKGHVYVLPMKDPSGRWQVLDLAPLMPWSMFTSAGKQLARGDVQQTAQTMGLVGGPVTDAIIAWKTNTDPFSGRQIAQKGDPVSLQMGAVLTYIYNMAAPPVLTNRGLVGPDLGDPMNSIGGKLPSALRGSTNKFGDPVSTVPQAAAGAVGFNVRSVDEVTDRAKALTNKRREIDDAKMRLKQILQDRALSPEQREKALTIYRKEIMDRTQKVREFADETQ